MFRKLLGALLFVVLASTTFAKPPQTIGDWVSTAWMKSAMSMHEEAFRVDVENGTYNVSWVTSGGNSHVDVPITSKTVAVFHTHFGEWNYLPSAEDIAAAKTTHVRIYVISAKAIWYVDANGVMVKFADR